MPPMSLKLFRSTGYSSILAPGETRVAMHPGWVVLAVSLWIGLACNVALWRALSRGADAAPGLAWALTAGACAASAVGVILSLMGWRRTLKPVATVLLLLAALGACGVWIQSLPVDAGFLNQRPSGLLPAWSSFLRWQVPALLVGLGLVPMLWLWSTHPRRLSGPEQLVANVSGMVVGGIVLVGSAWLLLRAFP
jgi:glucan phosphoethanolaminetransferase (alkaline phosphatase superfamily)